MATVLRDILSFLTAISLALTFWRWSLHRRFPLHQRAGKNAPGASALPSVTLLKPLKGCDAETKACLRSWFEQDYAAPIQLLFGVASPLDPACDVVRELLAEYPKADGRLVICAEALGANAKVSTLRQLEPLARHPLLIVSDADTHAPRDFVSEVAARAPEAGLVNCFYRLANPSTPAMRWEAIAVNADFWTSVLQAASLNKMDFALGAAMTLPREDLQGIGGFAALADYLADDFQLGHRIAANGRPLALAGVVVDCWEPPAGWRAVWRHQLRWARTIRACQGAPFFFSVLNNGGLWPLLLLTAAFLGAGAPWAVVLAGVALGFRIWSAQQQQARMIQAPAPWRYAWLVLVKDVLDFLLWLAAFWGNRIEWRGQSYRIEVGGRLRRLEPAT